MIDVVNEEINVKELATLYFSYSNDLIINIINKRDEGILHDLTIEYRLIFAVVFYLHFKYVYSVSLLSNWFIVCG